MLKDDLSRPVKMTVCAAGTVHISEPGGRIEPGTLPVFSTRTKAEAEAIRVRHCRHARDGSGLYTLNDPPRGIDDLGRVTDLFRADYEAPKGRKYTAAVEGKGKNAS